MGKSPPKSWFLLAITRFKLSEDEEPAAKTCPEVEEPEDEKAAKMWPNDVEEDEGYHTIRRRGRSQKVAKN